jgi:hypothetical protein
MVMGLVPEEEEDKLFKRLVEYYSKIYPGLKFSRKEATLTVKEIGDIYYTYPGEEAEVTAAEKMRHISQAINGGYSTPVILLQKKDRMLLLDGHRRIRVAFSQGLQWKALLLVPSKDTLFGIEAMILGKVKDLYGK